MHIRMSVLTKQRGSLDLLRAEPSAKAVDTRQEKTD